MRLCEDLQEEVITQFKEVLAVYKNLKEQCHSLADICKTDDNLKFEANYLDDFCKNDLGEQIQNTKEAILDKYYPVDYADDEEDYTVAGDRYQNSKENREKVFDN